MLSVKKKKSRQFNEVRLILSQMDLFFYYKKKKVYEEKLSLSFQRFRDAVLKLTNFLKSR